MALNRKPVEPSQRTNRRDYRAKRLTSDVEGGRVGEGARKSGVTSLARKVEVILESRQVRKERLALELDIVDGNIEFG